MYQAVKACVVFAVPSAMFEWSKRYTRDASLLRAAFFKV
jgi:hypothetical protein